MCMRQCVCVCLCLCPFCYKTASLTINSAPPLFSHAVLTFRFEFPSYSIPEPNGTLVVNIVLMSGSLDRSITLAVETSDDDAVGKPKERQLRILGCMPVLKHCGMCAD